jgi:tRNA A-37 threonylcarbamoyl transferase component Bud32
VKRSPDHRKEPVAVPPPALPGDGRPTDPPTGPFTAPGDGLVTAGLSRNTDPVTADTAAQGLGPVPAAGGEPFYPRFGDYELLGALGEERRGGMGIVYKARNLFFQRIEVLKVINDSRPSPRARGRFLNEMQAQAGLEHPHIVKVHYAGEVDGQLYFTMAYEEGGDLAAAIKKSGPPTPADAASLVRRVARAVEYAHSKQILHCDLKPHNIVLARDGTPKVTDFGLAQFLAGDADGRPGAGHPMGTPGYMPPEQADGDLDRIGPWSDVYGLGAVLYELLTGRPPFEGSVTEILRQVRDPAVRPIRPRDQNPKVPPRLEAICLKCLEKDPAKRYATAGELAEALSDCFRPPLWRRRWREAVAGLTILLLAAGLTGAGWQSYRSPRRDAAERVARAEQARQDGARGQAIALYATARARYTDLLAGLAPFDRRNLRFELARVQARLGELYEEERDGPSSEEALNSARSLLEELTAEAPGDADYALLLAEVHHNLGTHFSNLDQLGRAKLHYQAGLKLREGLRAVRADDPGFQRDLARSYGYLGDVQMILDDSAGAKQSYEAAEKLRERLARERPADAEAHCLHARDFANWGTYYDWQGDPREAARQHRKRLDYYRANHACLGPRLPGAYRTERADAAVAVAELEIDLAGPADQVAGLLRAAADEYTGLLDGQSEDDCCPELQAGLAQTHLGWGRHHAGDGTPDGRKQAADELHNAEKLIKALDDAGKAQSDDYYNLAVAAALRAELAATAADRAAARALALERLEKAVRKGFRNRNRLLRDTGLRALQGPALELFDRVLAGLAARLKAPA